MRTNQNEIADKLFDIFTEVQKLQDRVRTGYYDRDDAIMKEIKKVLVVLDDVIGRCDDADECDKPYSDVDPCESAKAEAELKMFLATC